MNFNLLDIDILKEIANIGSGNAVTSLSNIVNKKFYMNVPEVKMTSFKDLSNILGGAENLISALLFNISGDINGMIMYLMDEASSCRLINLVDKNKNISSFSQFQEMELSIITEVGNILTSSYLTALSNLLNTTINKSIPYLSIDMAGAILSVPAIEFGKVLDNALLIKSSFNGKQNLSGYFILIPDFNNK